MPSLGHPARRGAQAPERGKLRKAQHVSAGTRVSVDRVIFDSEGKGRKRSALPRFGAGVFESGSSLVIRPSRKGGLNIMESLILAQNERWRRVLSMQVGR